MGFLDGLAHAVSGIAHGAGHAVSRAGSVAYHNSPAGLVLPAPTGHNAVVAHRAWHQQAADAAASAASARSLARSHARYSPVETNAYAHQAAVQHAQAIQAAHVQAAKEQAAQNVTRIAGQMIASSAGHIGSHLGFLGTSPHVSDPFQNYIKGFTTDSPLTQDAQKQAQQQAQQLKKPGSLVGKAGYQLASQVAAPTGDPRFTGQPVSPLPNHPTESMAQVQARMKANQVMAHHGGFNPVGIAGALGSSLAKTIIPGYAALTKVADTAKGIGQVAPGIAGRLVTQAAQLPQTSIEGTTQMGAQLAHDIAAGNFHGTGKMISAAASQDPLVALVSHGPGRALALANKYPLNAVLDFAGGAGAADKLAGAVARQGAKAVTGHIPEAISTARVPKELVPEIPGTMRAQHYPRGLIAGQVARHPGPFDKLGIPALMPGVGRDAQLRQQVSWTMGPARKAASDKVIATGKAFNKELKQLRKVSKPAVGVAQYHVAFGGGRDMLHQLQDELTQARDGAFGQLNKDQLKNTNAHIANIANYLLKATPESDAQLQRVADTYHQRQLAIEQAKVAHGISTPGELQGGLDKQYALARIPGTAYIDKQVRMGKNGLVKSSQFPLHPDVVAKRTAAARELAAALRNQRDVIAAVGRLKGAHTGASRTLSDVTKRIPLDPATDSLTNHALDLRSMIEQSRAQLPLTSQEALQRASDRVKAAKGDLNAAKADNRRLGGLVIHDPNARPMLRGPLKGLQLRPLTHGEVAQHMAGYPIGSQVPEMLTDSGAEHAAHVAAIDRQTAMREGMTHEPSTPSYVNMTNPDRVRPVSVQQLGQGVTSVPSATGRAYTGRAAQIGDWRPGFSALGRSQIGDLRQIGQAEQRSSILDRFGMKQPDGSYFNLHNWQDAAAAYAERHPDAPKLLPVVDTRGPGGSVVLMPEPVVGELQRQLKLDRPTGFGRALMGLNKMFRNTVLPMSSKLPVMHTAEAGSRLALHGATPLDYFRGKSHLDAIGPSERAFGKMSPEEQLANADARHQRQLAENLMTPGSLATHAGQTDAEAMGHMPSEHGRLFRAATAVPRAWYDTIAPAIIHLQRIMEKPAQTTALGIADRRALQEFGHSWLDANTSVSRYADELAKPNVDPATATALREDAARKVHQILGQYNNFTSTARAFTSRAMPFGPWYANAARLVFHEMPIHHPLTTAGIADVAHANQPAWDAAHKGLPADMSAFLNLGPNHWLDVGKFGPLGIDKNPIETAAQLAFPALAPLAEGAFGVDPFGNQLKDAKGKKLGAFQLRGLLQGLENMGEGVLGPAGKIARAVQNKGGTLGNESLPLLGQTYTKPGSEHGGGAGGLLGGLNKEFNPFFGVYYNPNSGGGGRRGKGPGGRLGGGGAGGGVPGGPVGGGVSGGGVPGGALRTALPRNAEMGFQNLSKAQQVTRAQTALANVIATLAARGQFPATAGKNFTLRFPTSAPPGVGAWVTTDSTGKRTMNLPPAMLKQLADPTSSLHGWAQQALVHELSHTGQNNYVMASPLVGNPEMRDAQGRPSPWNPVAEGGAESFAQARAPQFTHQFIPSDSPMYEGATHSMQYNVGPSWYLHDQFQPHASLSPAQRKAFWRTFPQNVSVERFMKTPLLPPERYKRLLRNPHLLPDFRSALELQPAHLNYTR